VTLFSVPGVSGRVALVVVAHGSAPASLPGPLVLVTAAVVMPSVVAL